MFQTARAWWHLVSFSWKKGLPRNQQLYAADDSQGQGVSIFVIDSGVNLTGPITRVSHISHAGLPCINHS